MLNRFVFLFTTTILVLGLTACGGRKDEDALLGDEEESTETAAATSTAAPAGAPAAPAAGAATLTGKVAFNGTPPTSERLKMDADAFCKGAHAAPVYAQEVVVNSNGTLQHVIVYVKEGVSGSYPAPSQAVLLDQKGCQYFPHVFGIQTGQPLTIKNSDGTLHNIHALPTKNAEFNIGQPFQGMETVKKFDQVEVGLRFKCDVHKWMGAYAAVLNHPFFATTNDQGTFEIKNLPAGTYVVEAWHEKYGPQTQNVTVSGTESKTVDFAFGG